MARKMEMEMAMVERAAQMKVPVIKKIKHRAMRHANAGRERDERVKGEKNINSSEYISSVMQLPFLFHPSSVLLTVTSFSLSLSSPLS